MACMRKAKRPLVYLAVALAVVSFSAASTSAADSGLSNHITGISDAEVGTLEDTATDSQSSRICHFGLGAGFPFIVGLEFEHFLMRDTDGMPSLLVSSDFGYTLGVYGSIKLEKRLWRSPFYAGLGYHYTYIYFGVAGGDVGVVIKEPYHSLVCSIAARSSYKKGTSFNGSLGLLVTPELFSDLPVMPALQIAVIFGD